MSVFIQFSIAFSNHHAIIQMFFPVLLSHICLCLSISSPSYHLVKLSPHHLDPRGGWFFSLLTASCRPQSGSLFNQRPLLSIPLPLLCCPAIKPVLSGWMCCVRLYQSGKGVFQTIEGQSIICQLDLHFQKKTAVFARQQNKCARFKF